jgi:hypothetical protein
MLFGHAQYENSIHYKHFIAQHVGSHAESKW